MNRIYEYLSTKNCLPFRILCDVIVIVGVSKKNEDGDIAADCVSVNIVEFSSIASNDLGAKEFNPPTIKEGFKKIYIHKVDFNICNTALWLYFFFT